MISNIEFVHDRIKDSIIHTCGECDYVLGEDVTYYLPWRREEKFKRFNYCPNCGEPVVFAEYEKPKGTAAGY